MTDSPSEDELVTYDEDGNEHRMTIHNGRSLEGVLAEADGATVTEVEGATMRLAIVGSRDIYDPRMLAHGLRRVRSQFPGVEIVEIVSGGARGADWMAEDYARRNGIPVKVFPAEWNRHGRKAGFLRNREIVAYADVVLAIWDGESKGTAMTRELALRQRKPVVTVLPEDLP
jgi:predicted Rossmann fold nucleotide-binding protein DprA/Smf involved in DNA uptake